MTGHASLDYPLGLAGRVEPDATAAIAWRDPSAWPRPGGCPTHVATAAVAAGARAAPVQWLGDDAAGAAMAEALAALGLDTRGVAVVEGGRTPASVMIHQGDGSTACLFDAGLGGREQLTEAQRTAIGEATHLCLTVGPPQLQDAILDARPAGARLFWAVKNDPASFTLALRARLAAEADVIFLNVAERVLLGPTEAVIVETRGRLGVRASRGGMAWEVPVEPVKAWDPTGAGDALVGGWIAAEMAGEACLEAAAWAGVRAAAAMLRARAGEGT